MRTCIIRIAMCLALLSSAADRALADGAVETQDTAHPPAFGHTHVARHYHANCEHQSIDVAGDHNDGVFDGQCSEIIIMGNFNSYVIATTSELTVMGNHNIVRYQKRPGSVSDLGVENVIETVPKARPMSVPSSAPNALQVVPVPIPLIERNN